MDPYALHEIWEVEDGRDLMNMLELYDDVVIRLIEFKKEQPDDVYDRLGWYLLDRGCGLNRVVEICPQIVGWRYSIDEVDKLGLVSFKFGRPKPIQMMIGADQL